MPRLGSSIFAGMTNMSTLVDRLSDYVGALSYPSLAGEVVHQTKRLVAPRALWERRHDARITTCALETGISSAGKGTSVPALTDRAITVRSSAHA